MSSESPTGYNAAADLIGRNLAAGRGGKDRVYRRSRGTTAMPSSPNG